MLTGVNLNGNEIEFTPVQVEYMNAMFKESDIDGFLDINTDNNYEEFAYFGGFRSGKSYCTQLSVFLICLRYPNVRALYVRDTYAQLQDSVIKQFRDDFEQYEQFTYKITDREFHFKNGSVIKCRAFDRDTNILSAEYDLIASCQTEDIKQALFLQLFGRLSGNRLPKKLLLTEGNPANTFVKQRYKDSTQEERDRQRIFFVEAPTTDNQKNLDSGYIERLKESYPANWFNRYVLGGWDSIDEAVFSEFRESIHVIDPIDPAKISKHFKISLGGDYGYRNPATFIWAYKDYDGNIIIFDEWGDTEQSIEDIARASERHGSHIIAYDYSTKRPDRDGKSVWTELLKYSLKLIESNKDEIRNLTQINALFKQGKLFITRNCSELIKEIRNYKWKRLKLGEEKNFSEEPIDKDNHYIDAMLYDIAYIEDLKSKEPEIIPFHNTLKGMTIRVQKKSNYHRMG